MKFSIIWNLNILEAVNASTIVQLMTRLSILHSIFIKLNSKSPDQQIKPGSPAPHCQITCTLDNSISHCNTHNLIVLMVGTEHVHAL